MKNRNLIKKEYLTKINKLKEHNQLYYEKSKPKISDAEYDELKKHNQLYYEKSSPKISDSKYDQLKKII